MKTARSIAAALPSAPTRSLRTTLVRRVPLSPLIKTGTVDYLFASGRPSRFNTAGVKCVYFAEDEPTAAAEYERHTRPLHQPFATFFAEVELAAVLDLCATATLKALSLTVGDLQANWIRAKRPTATQLLGEAVSQQALLAAIRFPYLKGCATPPPATTVLPPTDPTGKVMPPVAPPTTTQPPLVLASASVLKWSGEIPPQKWMNFYTKILSKFASARGLKLIVKVEVSPEGGISKQKLDETKSALRELGLNEDATSE